MWGSIRKNAVPYFFIKSLMSSFFLTKKLLKKKIKRIKNTKKMEIYKKNGEICKIEKIILMQKE